ncbi:MAG: hypothetical protein F4X47_05560 [Gammaproteobacteria bacterium]|nr:hypothetical protein [Gammaproteobacteria bacterium]
MPSLPERRGAKRRYSHAKAEDGGIRWDVFEYNCPICRRYKITRNAIRIMNKHYADNRESIAAYIIPRANDGAVIDSEMLGFPKPTTTN